MLPSGLTCNESDSDAVHLVSDSQNKKKSSDFFYEGSLKSFNPRASSVRIKTFKNSDGGHSFFLPSLLSSVNKSLD